MIPDMKSLTVGTFRASLIIIRQSTFTCKIDFNQKIALFVIVLLCWFA
jgi:hypothetical protein